MNRFKSLLGIFAFSLLLLGVMPQTASAQYGDILEGVFGNRRNDRNNDRYGSRAVNDAIRRVESRADDFRDTLDDALDNSRWDGRRREDNILNVADNFERAAKRLGDRYDDNGRNSRRGESEARNLLQLGRQLDNFVYNFNNRNNNRRSNSRRLESEWASIRRDLQTIADFYGYNFGYNNNRRTRNDDDIYDDDNRRNRRNRNDNYPF